MNQYIKVKEGLSTVVKLIGYNSVDTTATNLGQLSFSDISFIEFCNYSDRIIKCTKVTTDYFEYVYKLLVLLNPLDEILGYVVTNSENFKTKKLDISIKFTEQYITSDKSYVVYEKSLPELTDNLSIDKNKKNYGLSENNLYTGFKNKIYYKPYLHNIDYVGQINKDLLITTSKGENTLINLPNKLIISTPTSTINIPGFNKLVVNRIIGSYYEYNNLLMSGTTLTKLSDNIPTKCIINLYFNEDSYLCTNYSQFYPGIINENDKLWYLPNCVVIENDTSLKISGKIEETINNHVGFNYLGNSIIVGYVESGVTKYKEVNLENSITSNVSTNKIYLYNKIYNASKCLILR